MPDKNETFCSILSRDFIKKLAEIVRSGREGLRDSDEIQADAVFIGNLATDKYRDCLRTVNAKQAPVKR